MRKIIFLLFSILLLNSCSFNQNSKFWNEDTKNIVINNQNDIVGDSSYKLMKEQIIEYGKNKDFPDINN